MADSGISSLIYLIVGLGNPGSEYEYTRHNVGFQVIELLARRWSTEVTSKKFHALIGELRRDNRKIILMKPQTYMNRSGLSVGEAVQFYKLDPSKDLLVISDDLDLPPGKLRLRPSGSSGGQNGLNSIIDSLGTNQFPRLRVGIGRQPGGGNGYLLNPLSKKGREELLSHAELAASAVETILASGVTRAMETVNQKGTTE